MGKGGTADAHAAGCERSSWEKGGTAHDAGCGCDLWAKEA